MAITKQVLSKTFSPMNLIGDALSFKSSYDVYKNSRKEGDVRAISLAKSAGSLVWTEAYYSALNNAATSAFKGLGAGDALTGIGTLLVSLGVPMAVGATSLVGISWENTAQKLTNAYAQKGRFGSGYFNMSEVGYTMRQRSLNAIRSNGLNLQSALGNEARTYFRSSL